MKKDNHITAFYIEVLLLTLVLIGIVLVLTQIFALGRKESASARELTDAVCLAQNAAEAFSASDSGEELRARLDENGNTALVYGDNGPVVTAGYDAALQGDRDGRFRLTAAWEEESAEAGRLIRCTITVTSAADGREIYSLRTALFRKEAAA